MARKAIIRLDDRTLDKIAHSSALLKFATEVAQELADKAGSGYEVVPDATRRKSRVIAMVIDPRPGALWIEAKNGNLARALGQMKG
jgi:hypothetical protein